jgi:hypothetical protein
VTPNAVARRLSDALTVSLLLVATAAGQAIPTGTLTGTVTDGTAPLPGVTVTVTSPNQQGTRVAYSTVTGQYILPMLPPGPYVVRFDLQGFQTIETTVKISGDLTASVDAVMPRVTTVAEEVTVTGRYDTISTTATDATAYEPKLIQVLPVSRDVSSYVNLTPGTVQLGGAPFYQTQITGAASSENLNLIDGAAAGDNFIRYLLPLYIEDAIQEVTTTLSSVSAEYGRFTGGVVSALTRSGGNEFHGSLRLNLTNPKWTAPTPLTIERTDTIDQVWEGTLGGYILKDRLWFFLGGRTATATTSLQTDPPVSIPYDQTTRQDRYEGKLTLALSPNHRLIGSYLDVEETRENWGGGYALDTYYTMRAPESIAVLNYSGVLSNTFSLEAQYSARKKAYTDFGSRYTDVERGTPVYDMGNNWVLYNSPMLCAVCPDPNDQRDNSDAFAKASLFLSTEKAGSHDLRVGVDLYDDMWKYNAWVSGSGYYLYTGAVNIVGTGTSAKYYPVILPGESFIEYDPIFEMSNGTHFKTQSAFVNDVWRLDNHFSFNMGVRYDQNDGTDASGTKVAKDSKWSPRLSVTWDPKGNGATQVTLGYGEYVAAIMNSVANSQSPGGHPAGFGLSYEGPPINAEGNEVQTHEALREVFAWLDSIGGPMANPQLWLWAGAPGYTTFIGDNLRSPSTAEWTAGVSRRLGTRGFIRLDYVNKVWSDFYTDRIDMTTGQSQDPYGNVYDREIMENDNTFTRRKYWGLLLQGNYRFGDRLQVGGNYTYSKLYGNDCGTLGAFACTMDYYPEYNDPKWYDPSGYLEGDRRHKLNVYASWDAVSTRAFAWNLSLLQRHLSGRPYFAVSSYVLVSPYVTNPGYATPPSFTWYPFTAVDAYHTDAVTSADLAMTFTFKLAGLELYVNPIVTNLFNNQAVINPNTTVYTRLNESYLNWFNPFAETPKECPQNTTCNPADGYNWQKGPDFGKATYPSDYQAPRTFVVNIGLRF